MLSVQQAKINKHSLFENCLLMFSRLKHALVKLLDIYLTLHSMTLSYCQMLSFPGMFKSNERASVESILLF